MGKIEPEVVRFYELHMKDLIKKFDAKYVPCEWCGGLFAKDFLKERQFGSGFKGMVCRRCSDQDRSEP